MNTFIEYIEKSCAGLGDSRMTYLYKRRLLDKMQERAREITRAGMKDTKVITDLVADEFGDLVKGFDVFVKEEKKRRRAQIMKYALPIGGFVSLVIIFICYFSVSKATGAWDKSWLIIVGGIFALVIFYLGVAIKKLSTMRRVYHPIARVLIAGCVMLASVFAFLSGLVAVENRIVTWPIVLAGVSLMLLADLGFAYATKQKFRTISFFVYMPVISTMLYIILAAYNVVTWLGGWPVIFAGLAVDLIYILAVLAWNMKYFVYRQEVEE